MICQLQYKANIGTLYSCSALHSLITYYNLTYYKTVTSHSKCKVEEFIHIHEITTICKLYD